MMKNDPSFMMFNGRLAHQMLTVAPGDLIRAYFVNVGPGTAAVHVMGTILDRVIDGSRQVDGVQTYGVAAGSGAMIEFRIPEEGTFGLVDHDRLAYLPMGLMLGFHDDRGRTGTFDVRTHPDWGREVAMREQDRRTPRHPERICWGCDKRCPAESLACGNGTVRTMHPVELFGEDWREVLGEEDPEPPTGP
jgi:hypothetical protein